MAAELGWGTGAIVLPPSVVPFAALKERLWQRLLSVRRVHVAFDSLQGMSAGSVQVPKAPSLRVVDAVRRAGIVTDA